MLMMIIMMMTDDVDDDHGHDKLRTLFRVTGSLTLIYISRLKKYINKKNASNPITLLK